MVQTPTTSETFFGLDVSDLAFIKRSLISIRRKISKRFFLLEFGVDELTYGEARVSKDQVFCTKINRIKLDKDAIEKGSPTDPSAMGEFLKQIIEEENLWAHRVAITLPPEASLSRIIYLPSQLNYQEAIDFISNPTKSGFQYPIALAQTDFDIVPINCLPTNKENKTKPYFLTCIPSKLIDNIINTISKADLELHSLDIAYSSIGRLANTEINKLKSNQALIILELNLECSHIYIFSSKGPIYVNALAAIRPFETTNNYNSSLSLEESIVSSEDYHTISHLDLKVLLAELNKEIENIKINFKLEISGILLTGINSSHPGISDFFKESLKLYTSILRSMSSDEIADISHPKTICVQELNRLVGLSLTMTEPERLFSDDTDKDIDVNSLNLQNDETKESNKTEELKNKDNFDDFLLDYDSKQDNKIESDSSNKNIDQENKSNVVPLTNNDLNNNDLPLINNSQNIIAETKEDKDIDVNSLNLQNDEIKESNKPKISNIHESKNVRNDKKYIDPKSEEELNKSESDFKMPDD